MLSPTETPDIRLVGDDLLAVLAANPTEGQAMAAHLRQAGGWLEVVAGLDSVVVQFNNALLDAADAVAHLCDAIAATPSDFTLPDTLIEVPVCYGGEFGPDLDDACTTLRLSAEEFVRIHTASEYRVEMLGFTPGFAYVGGLDANLALPRRDTPRAFVATGSVGIAGRRTGLYSLPGPGGWSIIGRTPLPLFDATRTPPFRLAAGVRIRFRAISPDEFNAASQP